MRSDLVSLVVELAIDNSIQVPSHLGRAIYSQLLRIIDETDSNLAMHLHDMKGPKPFTCSNLIGGRRVGLGKKIIEPEMNIWLRYTGISSSIAEHLIKFSEQPKSSLELDGHYFQVKRATINPQDHPWAGNISIEALATPFLLAQQSPIFRLPFHLASPTVFKNNNVYHPVPMGNWFFGSLLDRWNAFSDVALAAEVRRFADECVVLSSYQLRTGRVPFKNISIPGAVGNANFSLLIKDRFWASMLNLLGQYAFYSGVGYQTTAGLGQVRLNDNDQESADKETEEDGLD